MKSELSRMRNTISQGPVTAVYYILHKVLSHLFQGLYVDMKAVNKIRTLS